LDPSATLRTRFGFGILEQPILDLGFGILEHRAKDGKMEDGRWKMEDGRSEFTPHAPRTTLHAPRPTLYALRYTLYEKALYARTLHASMPRLLLVFGKLPVPGEVKTRLTPPLTAIDAARLYEAFLRDTLDVGRMAGVDVWLCLAPPADPIPTGLVPDGVHVVVQQGADLGARMENAFASAFEAGYAEVVIIGSDHPTLPVWVLSEAFRRLDQPGALCIGPSEDGGYYLLGMNEPHAALFQDMAFSRDDVFEETMKRARNLGLHVTRLRVWFDVDRAEDLDRLARDLEAHDRLAPHTRRVLEELRREPSAQHRH
jgi:uncharacterized protein